MAAMQRGPVLFSLKHIMGQRDGYIGDDEQAHEREVALELASIVAERSVKERALSHAQVQAEARAREETMRLAEVARFEAMRLAAIERARSEAEMRARIEALTLELEHERAMRVLQIDVHPRWLQKVVFFAGLGAVFIFGMGLGAYVNSTRPMLKANSLRPEVASVTAPPVQFRGPAPADASVPALGPAVKQASAP